MSLNRVGLPDDYERADLPDMRLIQRRVREITLAAQRDTPYVIPAQPPSFAEIYDSLVNYLNDYDDANLATSTSPRVSPDMYTALIDWLTSHAPTTPPCGLTDGTAARTG